MARINEYRMLELGSAAGQQPQVISVTASSAATPTVAGAEPTKKASKGDKERKERDKRVKARRRKTWDSARLVHFGGNVDSAAIHRWQRDPPASIAPEPELHEKSEDNDNDDGDERLRNERVSSVGLTVIVEPATDDHQRLTKPRRESVQFDELEKLLKESFAPKTSARRALRSPRIAIPGLAPAGTAATTAAAIEGDAPKRKVVGSREEIDRMLDDLLSAAVPTIAATAPSMESTSPGEIACMGPVAATSGPPATTLPASPAQTPGAATLFVFFVLVLLWWVNNWV